MYDIMQRDSENIRIVNDILVGWIDPGVYILQNTMARGGEMVPGKNEKWDCEEQSEKEGEKKKKGERKKKKRKRGNSDFFANILQTLLIIV